jgi:ribonuclease-3
MELVRDFLSRLRLSGGAGSDSVRRFDQRFGIRFRDAALLEIALTHRSSLGQQDAVISNERLEFLGDAVLGLAATESLFRSLGDADEGTLTKARSRVVNKNVLGRIGIDMGILELLNYARDEINGDDRALLTLSADALEAVIGAIYLDRGFKCASEFVRQNVLDPAACNSLGETHADYKSRLQEICQADFKVQPQYKVVRRIGPEHRKVFQVEVVIRGKPYGSGSGRSKKEAEQQAAGRTIERIRPRGDRNPPAE